jgi:hypothetical protein
MTETVSGNGLCWLLCGLWWTLSGKPVFQTSRNAPDMANAHCPAVELAGRLKSDGDFVSIGKINGLSRVDLLTDTTD